MQSKQKIENEGRRESNQSREDKNIIDANNNMQTLQVMMKRVQWRHMIKIKWKKSKTKNCNNLMQINLTICY